MRSTMTKRNKDLNSPGSKKEICGLQRSQSKRSQMDWRKDHRMDARYHQRDHQTRFHDSQLLEKGDDQSVVHKKSDPTKSENDRTCCILPTLCTYFRRCFTTLHNKLDSCQFSWPLWVSKNSDDGPSNGVQTHCSKMQWMWTDIWEATVDFQNAVWLDTAWRDLEISPKPFYQWATHLFSESLHADQRATLLTVVKSDEFEIARGTEQGDLFSSSLFNSVLQSAMEKDIGIWKEKSCGNKLGDENKACMSNLRFVDDVLLLASSFKKIKKMHGSERARNPTWQNEGSYQPRVRHSERSRHWRDPGRNISFFLKEKAKYLGQMISLTDQETIEIQHRIRCAWSRTHQTPTGIDTRVFLLRHRFRLYDSAFVS